MNVIAEKVKTMEHPTIKIDGEAYLSFGLDKHEGDIQGNPYSYQHLIISAYNASNTSLISTMQINNVCKKDIEEIISVLKNIAKEIE